jgi:hypothetical protein
MFMEVVSSLVSAAWRLRNECHRQTKRKGVRWRHGTPLSEADVREILPGGAD